MHIFSSIWLQCLTRYRLIQVNLVLKSFSSQILQRNSCFPLDKKVQCCNGALWNLENQHKLYNIANIVHTDWGNAKYLQNNKSSKKRKLLGNFNSSFVHFILFYCSFHSFFLLWMVLCLYICIIVYNLGYLSFEIVCILYPSTAQDVQSVCTWLAIWKNGATICTT